MRLRLAPGILLRRMWCTSMRFTKGNQYDPSEWFVAPIEVIDKAITKIVSGEIIDFVYDRSAQQLVLTDGS